MSGRFSTTAFSSIGEVFDDGVQQIACPFDLRSALLDAVFELEIECAQFFFEPALPIELAAANCEQPADNPQAHEDAGR